MKILKYGETPVTTRVFECVQCHCIFEADCDEYKNTQVDYNGECIISSNCPECGRSALECIQEEYARKCFNCKNAKEELQRRKLPDITLETVTDICTRLSCSGDISVAEKAEELIWSLWHALKEENTNDGLA